MSVALALGLTIAFADFFGAGPAQHPSRLGMAGATACRFDNLTDARTALGIDHHPVPNRIRLAAALVLARQGGGAGADDADVKGAAVLFRQQGKFSRAYLQQRRRRRIGGCGIFGCVGFVRAQPRIFDRA